MLLYPYIGKEKPCTHAFLSKVTKGVLIMYTLNKAVVQSTWPNLKIFFHFSKWFNVHSNFLPTKLISLRSKLQYLMSIINDCPLIYGHMKGSYVFCFHHIHSIPAVWKSILWVIPCHCHMTCISASELLELKLHLHVPNLIRSLTIFDTTKNSKFLYYICSFSLCF